MTVVQKIAFNEEQREYVKSILKEHRMSRVALIRYLVKMKAADVDTAEDIEPAVGEMNMFINNIIDVLSRLTDKEYSDIILLDV